MGFDFSKLSHDGAISSITDPAALFDALSNKSEGYGYLRAVQKTVNEARHRWIEAEWRYSVPIGQRQLRPGCWLVIHRKRLERCLRKEALSDGLM